MTDCVIGSKVKLSSEEGQTGRRCRISGCQQSQIVAWFGDTLLVLTRLIIIVQGIKWRNTTLTTNMQHIGEHCGTLHQY